jgi:hypothetical protein
MIQNKLLVHIAFHYNNYRVQYLLTVLENFKNYQLSDIHVVIDTNTEETKEKLKDFIAELPFQVNIHCHLDLDHPFSLTWTHRQQMLEHLEDYDIFMYLEDDILIPWAAFEAWLSENEAVYKTGRIRGFLRVENPGGDKLYATDYTGPMPAPVIWRIGQQYYFEPSRCYHGCWVYTKKQMKDFIQSSSWMNREIFSGDDRDRAIFRGDIRASAAAGMMKPLQGFHLLVLPINSDGTFPDEVFIYHLPNNYSTNPDTIFGKTSTENLFIGKIKYRNSLKGAVIFYQNLLKRYKIMAGYKRKSGSFAKME